MFFKNESKAPAQEPLQNNAEMSASISKIEKESVLRVDVLESLIIKLDLEIMDENETDASDELRRKELRPLTRTLMNQLKIDRNLTKLMLQEIKVATGGTSGSLVISERFRVRFTNVVKELATIQEKLSELVPQFIEASPGILEPHLKVSDSKFFTVSPTQ